MTEHLLSLMTFLPLLGMLVLLFIPRENDGLLKGFTLVVTLVTFVISLPLAFDDVFKTSARCSTPSSPTGSASANTSR